MKQNSIPELDTLRVENYENIFNLYQDINNNYYYNLLQTIHIPDNLPEGYYDTYIVGYQDTWTVISYKIYGTPNLWWVITHTNKIINPTKIPEPGVELKILKTGVVKEIISQISLQDT